MRLTRAALIAVAASRGRGCLFGPQLSRLTPPERRELEAALLDPSISLPSIQTVLARRGVTVSNTTLHHHRHRRCGRCYGSPK